MSACSTFSVSSLESLYRREASLDFFDDENGEDGSDEQLEHVLEEMASKRLASVQELPQMLNHISAKAKAYESSQADANEPEKVPDPDLSLPDGKLLVSLTSVKEEKEKGKSSSERWAQKAPQTLNQAFESAGVGGDFWPKLWQLCAFLRCGKSGMDGIYLRKSELIRQQSANLNWHQLLG